VCLEVQRRVEELELQYGRRPVIEAHQIDAGVGRRPGELLGRGQGQVGRLQLAGARRQGADLLLLVQMGLRPGARHQ